MKEEKIYRCEYCHKGFDTPRACERHKRWWHAMPLDLALKILGQVEFRDDDTYSCLACQGEDPSVRCSSCLNMAMDKVLAEIKGRSNEEDQVADDK